MFAGICWWRAAGLLQLINTFMIDMGFLSLIRAWESTPRIDLFVAKPWRMAIRPHDHDYKGNLIRDVFLECQKVLRLIV